MYVVQRCMQCTTRCTVLLSIDTLILRSSTYEHVTGSGNSRLIQSGVVGFRVFFHIRNQMRQLATAAATEQTTNSKCSSSSKSCYRRTVTARYSTDTSTDHSGNEEIMMHNRNGHPRTYAEFTANAIPHRPPCEINPSRGKAPKAMDTDH